MEKVKLIPDGYKWQCPSCKERHYECEYSDSVQCSNCSDKFKVESSMSAIIMELEDMKKLRFWQQRHD